MGGIFSSCKDSSDYNGQQQRYRYQPPNRTQSELDACCCDIKLVVVVAKTIEHFLDTYYDTKKITNDDRSRVFLSKFFQVVVELIGGCDKVS